MTETEEAQQFAQLDFYQRIMDSTTRFIHEFGIIEEYRVWLKEELDIDFEVESK